jgi:hypothetical protein
VRTILKAKNVNVEENESSKPAFTVYLIPANSKINLANIGISSERITIRIFSLQL